jgi:prepilin-type N-terminal cleavage/methylation domain-containing protein
MTRKRQPSAGQDGFTIMELMIATVVLSVILLVASVLLTSIGGLYTKGTTGSQLQNNIRNILQTLSTTIEYSGASTQIVGPVSHSYPPINETAICVGDIKISYVPDTIPSTVSSYTIWQSQATPGCVPDDLRGTPAQSSANQNIGLSNEAVHYLKVSYDATSGLYTVEINAFSAAGIDQLVFDPTTPATKPVHCNGALKASDFCFTTALSTSIGRRLN